jgi:SAM-dependent methyltransferase
MGEARREPGCSSWSAYYDAQSGREPRELFRRALDMIDQPDIVDAECLAIDLGAGDGTETLELLRRGWCVLAIDREHTSIQELDRRVPQQVADRYEGRVAAFETLTLPRARLVYAGYSLPFCPPSAFPRLWREIEGALRPAGTFVGQFFGVKDDWSSDPDMTFFTHADVVDLLAGFRVLDLKEEDRDGTSFDGPKHWHLFHVIASRV